MKACQAQFSQGTRSKTTAGERCIQSQLTPSQLPRTNWEVVVVGAGPAGAMTALHLARAGCDVLLLDRFRFPRVKVCGEALIADALGALQRAGLLDEVVAAGRCHDHATIYSPSLYSFDVPGKYVTLERATLDALVARHAVELGATFCQGHVAAVRPIRQGVVLQVVGEPRPIKARVLVLATGAAIYLACQLGLANGAGAAGVAVRGYIRATVGPDCLLGFYGRDLAPGYGWVFPMGRNLYNLGVVRFRCGRDINLRCSYEGFLRSFPPARALVAAAEAVVPPKGAVIRCGLPSAALQAGPVLLAGEAAGTTLPFTAEGIGKAMRSGEIAASVIRESLERHDPSLLCEYPRRLVGELGRRYEQYERAQAWLSTPWLNDLMAWLAGRRLATRQRLAGILAESCEPAAVFSLAGVARSVLGLGAAGCGGPGVRYPASRAVPRPGSPGPGTGRLAETPED